MTDRPYGDITRILLAMDREIAGSEDELYGLVLDELRSLARHYLKIIPTEGMIDATGLVNEAWIRLHERGEKKFENRFHFFAIAGRAIRDAAVDEARRCGALKRGGGHKRVDINTSMPNPTRNPETYLELHRAVEKLRGVDASAADLIDLWIHIGLSHQEIAELRGVSLSTVRREWRFAKAFLENELQPREPEELDNPTPEQT